jgi:hypothetical protein
MAVVADSRGALNDWIAARARESREFRRELLADPRRVLESHLRQRLPRFVDVEVLEETADTIYLVLPYQPSDGQELSDDDLELVAGGKSEPVDPGGDCHGGGGRATRTLKV